MTNQPLATATGAVPAMVRQMFTKAGVNFDGIEVQGNIGETLVFSGVGPRNNALARYHLWAGETPEVALEACIVGGAEGIGARFNFSPAEASAAA